LNEFTRAVRGRPLPGVAWKSRMARVFPQISLSQTDDAYLIEAPVPGVEPGDLNVQLSGNVLTLSGRRSAPEVEAAAFHRRERRSGKFSRMFELPALIDATAVKAEIRHGVLYLTLPKAPEARPRTIDVKIV
ncbi:MAG TPA: Hsp20/alpha crystallin family protein, partial [Candidatus Ozemobacteraceae bacterium]|nr:Hsp20/alpha crystallin family protein [Candidatus Ozemobacteraceae bacterium]